jgi:acetyl esterase/lipase
MKKICRISVPLLIAAAMFSSLLSAAAARGQEPSRRPYPAAPSSDMAPLQVPARVIPVPADVSPELQKAIGRLPPLRERGTPAVPKSTEEWRKLIAAADSASRQNLAVLRKMFPVHVESQTIGEVKIYRIAPMKVAPENKSRLLIHFHGGGYILAGGEVAIGEAILMAYYGKIEVISVDYRMPPDHPFPAALDDAVSVWKEVIKTHNPGNIGLFGTSAGGGLTLATVHRLKGLKLPLPGAIAPGTPWSDLARTGDTYFTNDYIDGVIGDSEGFLRGCAELYAGKHDLKDPLISPLYGDFDGFPPSILTTGTRDLLESDTVRVYRKLRRAGVDARIQVFEAMSHAEYILLFSSPESREAFGEIAKFFEAHLGR